MTQSKLLLSLLYTTVVSSTVMLANGQALADCVIGTNAATCTAPAETPNGSLEFSPQFTGYVSGDYVVTLDNIDMNGFARLFGGLNVGPDGSSGIPLAGKGTININGDSDVGFYFDTNSNESLGGIGVVAAGDVEINLNGTSSVTVDSDEGLGGYSTEGNVTIKTATGTLVEELGGNESFDDAIGIDVWAAKGDVFIDAKGVVKSADGSAIEVEADAGDVTVIASNVVAGLVDTFIDNEVGGILVYASPDDEVVDFGNTEEINTFFTEAPAQNVKITATGPVSGYIGVGAEVMKGKIDIATGAGAIDAGGIGVGGRVFSGEINITTGTGDITTFSEMFGDGSSITARAGNSELFVRGIEAGNGGNIRIVTAGNLSGAQDGIDAYSVNGNITISTAANKAVVGGEFGHAIEAGVGFTNIDDTEEVVESTEGGAGNIVINANGINSSGRDAVRGWTRSGDTTITLSEGSSAISINDAGVNAEAGYAYFEDGFPPFLEGGGGNAKVVIDGTAIGNWVGANAWTREGTATTIIGATGVVEGKDGAGARAQAGFVNRDTNGDLRFGGSGDATVEIAGKATGHWEGAVATSMDGNAKVTTAAGSVVTGTNGAGVQAHVGDSEGGDGKGNATVVAHGTISGNWAGISAETRQGVSKVTVGATGVIEAKDGSGVQANAGFNNDGVIAGGGDVSVDVAGKVTGQGDGINANSVQNGKSEVKTTSTAIVTGIDGAGINAATSDLGSGGNVSVEANGKTSGNWAGINAWSIAADLVSIIAGETSDTTAVDGNAIQAGAGRQEKSGSGGDVSIIANGKAVGKYSGVDAYTDLGHVTANVGAKADITGQNDRGVSIFANAGDSKATIAGKVTGYWDGVVARTANGDSEVTTAAGSIVDGLNGAGIQASVGQHDVEVGQGDATVLVNGAVSGNWAGIEAGTRDGIVKVTVGATGVVEAKDGRGIQAHAGYNPEGLYNGGGETIVDVAGKVTGTDGGVNAFSLRNGSVLVKTTAASIIDGTKGAGINASAGVPDFGGGNIAIEANGKTTGGWAGINAWSLNAELVSIIAGETSDTTATDGHAIQAGSGRQETSGSGGAVSIVANGKAVGKYSGVDAYTNNGHATVNVGAKADITGQNDSGVSVFAKAGDSKATIAGKVTGYGNGVGAFADVGDVSITTLATANILGDTGHGIVGFTDEGNVVVTHAGKSVSNNSAGIRAGADMGLVSVTTAAGSLSHGATDRAGIDVSAGIGIQILNGGLAEGDWTGIYAGQSENVSAEVLIAVQNQASGVVRNTSLDLSRTAIETGGGGFVKAVVVNDGLVEGNIRVNENGAILNNGTWRTLGAENYASGLGILNSATGKIFAAHDAAKAEFTSLYGETGVANLGLMSIVDAAASSGNKIKDELRISGPVYEGGGVIAVNAYLDKYDNSISDLISVQGNATGQTKVRLVNTNSGGGSFVDEATGDGILVAVVEGTTAFDAFAVEGGVYSTGLFDYYIKEGTQAGVAGTTFELFSRPNDGSAAESSVATATVGGLVATSTGVWVDHQTGLRNDVNNGPVINSAASEGVRDDGSERNTIWMQGLAGMVNHSGDSNFNGRLVDTGYDQSIYGIVGGADFGTNLSNGGTVLFGLVGGYSGANVDFTSRTNSFDISGFSLGAYASYMNEGFYANALLRGDLLNLEHAVGATSGKTDVTAIGFRGDTGYAMRYGNMILEPLASLSIVNTSVDAYSVGLVNFGAGDTTAIDAAIGAKFSYQADAVAFSATGRLWNNFSGPANVSVTTGGVTSNSTGEGAFGGVYGEVAANLTASVADNISIFGGSSVKFDKDTNAFSGFGGVALTW